ncbi:MAG: 2-C-methyl-D-erythritol 2,4-cyclodiphosphate synthase [Bacteroidales bacterium]|nr:2-C-methyl-D-erythritol 2,4-cyclodiphosphate synthase [Bacteroidales bacterium]
MADIRIGYGYDAHALQAGRPLILGGVDIPHERGLLGHSDADVLYHALCDALLGALALGDIGQHFPDKDPAYKNIDSGILLKKVFELIGEAGYRVGNIDATLRLQRPKVAPFIPRMRRNIAEILSLSVDRVSVKATTTERMGFEGEERGVSASAVVLLLSDL